MMTPEDSVDAAELALGLLDGQDRAAALRRTLADRDFAEEVERWRDHFATLFAEVPAVAPPAGLAERIAGTAANDTARWRWATGGASALAAALALVLVMRPAVMPAPPVSAPVPARPALPLTAAMAPAGKGAPFAAIYDAALGEVRIAAGVETPAGKAAQLWRIGADGVPHSLGLLHAGAATAIPLSPADRAALAAGATLAVSIEPPGGSPAALPTGPVVASGKLLRV